MNTEGDSSESKWRHESEFIESIIKRVQQVVNQPLLNVARYPVGVDSRVEDLELLLQIGVEEVRMIGIYGVGGIGKTTLAKAIYNRILHHFDSSCFLSDVRSGAKASNGLVKLQKQLLDQILKTDFKVNSVAQGITMIKRRLGSKKVLIVLDDVDHMTQLESLTRERSWFGSGSLIIITTRDKHLLYKLRANERCEAKLLDDSEAMQLFSRHPFNNLSPPQEYDELAQDIIKYLGGLPLALVMYGSHLQGRSVEEWRHEFKKLRAIPQSDTQSVFLDMKCDELSLQQIEPKITGMRQLRLLREVELAFSSGNLMRSTRHCALLQACPSTKRHSQSIHSIIDCDESENELLIATDYRYDSCHFLIPCKNCNGCMMSSAQPCRFHGTLFLSLFIPTKKSPVGLFEVVHCPQRAVFPFKGQKCAAPSKQKQSSSFPYLNSMVAWCSSNQRQMLLHCLQPHEHSTNVGHESPEVIVDTQMNNQKRRKRSSTPWSAAGSISKEHLVQHYGRRLEDAARGLRVSVSTFKRLCRMHGISRWPSTKKMIEDASVSQSPNALLSDLQHKEGNPSLNQNMTGNSETTKEDTITQGRASAKQEQLYRSQLYSDSLSFENPTTNALARMPGPPENGMIREVTETSISEQNGRQLEREADSMDEMSHFNNQPSAILNYAPERQAVDSARKESFSGTIEGIEVGYNPTPESASEKQSYSSPYLDSMVVRRSSNGQQMLLHFSQTHESSINAGHESPGVLDTQTNNQKKRNKSSSPWSAAGSFCLEDIVQCYGMTRHEAAARLGVSVSTFKRLCREHGLSRWPTAKKMRENASTALSPNALVSALQHKDANLSLNQNMP